MPDFTPTQRRILQVLADGEPHAREELHKCLDDDLAGASAVRKHICLMRKVLRPMGQDVICQLRNRRLFYRQIRHLVPPQSME